MSILGVYGLMDTFPIGVSMNKGLTVRTARSQLARADTVFAKRPACGEQPTAAGQCKGFKG
jgi:hypothetical protein